MKYTVPMVRQVSAIRSLIAAAIVAGAALASYFLLGPGTSMVFFLALLLYALASRELFFRHHRRGIRFLRANHWEAAIAEFEASLADLEKHPWKDRLRSILALSLSAMMYREMAILNLAFAFGQTGNREQARRYYEQCLKEYPNNGIAIAAMNLLGK